jgi:hypothetical protein
MDEYADSSCAPPRTGGKFKRLEKKQTKTKNLELSQIFPTNTNVSELFFFFFVAVVLTAQSYILKETRMFEPAEQ